MAAMIRAAAAALISIAATIDGAIIYTGTNYYKKKGCAGDSSFANLGDFNDTECSAYKDGSGAVMYHRKKSCVDGTIQREYFPDYDTGCTGTTTTTTCTNCASTTTSTTTTATTATTTTVTGDITDDECDEYGDFSLKTVCTASLPSAYSTVEISNFGDEKCAGKPESITRVVVMVGECWDKSVVGSGTDPADITTTTTTTSGSGTATQPVPTYSSPQPTWWERSEMVTMDGGNITLQDYSDTACNTKYGDAFTVKLDTCVTTGETPIKAQKYKYVVNENALVGSAVSTSSTSTVMMVVLAVLVAAAAM